jgi:hypothetical protein
MIDVTMTPSIIGVSSRPLTVAEAPCTVCWYSGRNVIAPNIARPTRKLRAATREKFRIRNRCSGSIGSTARDSAHRNAATAATPTRARPMISGEPHAYSLPPQVVTSTIAVAATASRAAPR